MTGKSCVDMAESCKTCNIRREVLMAVRQVSSSAAKRKLGQLLEEVRGGDTVELTHYGRVFARITPVVGPKVGEAPAGSGGDGA